MRGVINIRGVDLGADLKEALSTISETTAKSLEVNTAVGERLVLMGEGMRRLHAYYERINTEVTNLNTIQTEVGKIMQDMKDLQEYVKKIEGENRDLSDAITEMIINQEPKRSLWKKIKETISHVRR